MVRHHPIAFIGVCRHKPKQEKIYTPIMTYLNAFPFFVIKWKQVLNKYISETGFCSRREADELIAQCRVTINGEDAHKGNRVNGW